MITLIVQLIVLGVIAWAIQTYLPMEGVIKNILMLVFVVIACVLVLTAFGMMPALR